MKRDRKRIEKGRMKDPSKGRIFHSPFSYIRLLSVSYSLASPSFSYPFSVFSSGPGSGTECQLYFIILQLPYIEDEKGAHFIQTRRSVFCLRFFSVQFSQVLVIMGFYMYVQVKKARATIDCSKEFRIRTFHI